MITVQHLYLHSSGETIERKKVPMATTAANGYFKPLTGLAKFLINVSVYICWCTSKICSGKLEQLNIPHSTLPKAKDVNGQNLHDLFPRRII